MGKKGKKSRRPPPAQPIPTTLNIARKMAQDNKTLGPAILQEQVEMRAQEEKYRQENPTDNQKLIDQMAACDGSADPAEVQQIIRTVFANVGLEFPQDDDYSDGDQSPIEQGVDDLREMFDRMFDFEQISNHAGVYYKAFKDEPDRDIMTILGVQMARICNTTMEDIKAGYKEALLY